MMKLYSGPLSMFGAKAEIALREKGIDYEIEMVPFDMKALYTPKHAVVQRVNPKSQVPVLIDGALELFDSTQIFEYLEALKPEPALWPSEARARARARLLEHKSDEIYFPHIVRLMSDPKAPGAHEATARYYDEMERTLGNGPEGGGWRVTTPMPTLPSIWLNCSAIAWAPRWAPRIFVSRRGATR